MAKKPGRRPPRPTGDPLKGVHVHVHMHADATLAARVDSLARQQETMMAKQADFEAALAEVDKETTRIGTLVTKLAGQLSDGGLSEAEEAKVLERLTAAGKALKSIAHDPAQPVPDPISEV